MVHWKFWEGRQIQLCLWYKINKNCFFNFSPSGLARSVTIGLRDFLSMPVQGFLRGPWGLLVGITQGSASLLRNITAGTVNSVTKLAASVARNLDRLSLDDEHLQRTEALRRSRPQGITDGFAQGLTGLGISILGAVGGLSRHALEAHSSVGVVTGFGRGLVGAVTKPISGAAELVALTGQGMLQTVGFNTMPIPREPTMPKNYTIEPSAAKIVWKFLPPMLATDQILFTALATLETKHDTVCIALTSNLIIFISLDKDELLEMYSIERAVSTVDEDDATLVSIRLILNPDDENDDIQGVCICLKYIVHNSFIFINISLISFNMVVSYNMYVIPAINYQWSPQKHLHHPPQQAMHRLHLL